MKQICEVPLLIYRKRTMDICYVTSSISSVLYLPPVSSAGVKKLNLELLLHCRSGPKSQA